MAEDIPDREQADAEREHLDEEVGVGIGDESIKPGTEEPRGDPQAPDPPNHGGGLDTDG